MYPPRLPDLFRGEQLQVLGRYEGHGRAAVTLKGLAGDDPFAESFDTKFPEIADDFTFIAPIWAMRKVGYLLDQIRLNGESVEVKRELIQLAREFSIATPYTRNGVGPGLFVGLADRERPSGQWLGLVVPLLMIEHLGEVAIGLGQLESARGRRHRNPRAVLGIWQVPPDGARRH